MKLSQPVIINSIPFKINNKYTNNYLILDDLDVTYNIKPKAKTITASIKYIPKTLVLALPSYYESIEDQISVKFLEDLLSYKLGSDPQKTIDSLLPYSVLSDPYGPASLFLRFLKAFGYPIDTNCSCMSWIREFNKNGSSWCLSNKDNIISILKDESLKNQIPFDTNIASLLIDRCIKLSDKLKNKRLSK